MKTRCENKNSTAYGWYGGAGVKICKEWAKDFKAFYDWAIDNGWEKGLRLDKDKIPKEKGIPAISYNPEMCCFITHKENCNNRSSNHPMTFNGITKNMTEWEHDLGFPKDTIYRRLKYGWSIKDSLTIPPRPQFKWIEYNGIKLIKKDWAKKIGVSSSTLGYLLKRYSFDQIYNKYKK